MIQFHWYVYTQKNCNMTGVWLMPVIPGTSERERRAQTVASPKLVRPPCPSISWRWWLMSIIPVTREAQVEGLQSQADLGKNISSYMENNLKQKGLEPRLKW
jgi:hypothetical protein